MINGALQAHVLNVSNPMQQALQIGQMGQNIQSSLMNRLMQQKKMEIAASMAPTEQALKGSQAQMNLYKLSHPGLLASGAVQQSLMADELDSQGKHAEADAIRKNLSATQNYRQSFANYYNQRGANFIPNMFPANVRPFILDYMAKQGILGKNFNELLPEQQQEVTQIGRQAQNWTSMPSTLKIGATIAPALEKNVNQLESQIQELSNSGFVNGIQGWADLGGARIESMLGRDDPKGLQQYQTKVTNIYSTAITSAKQLARLMGLQNTDQAAKAAQSILGTKKDFINNPMSMNLSKIRNLRQLMKNEVNALQGGGGPGALQRLSQLNIGSSSPNSKDTTEGNQKVKVRSPEGKFYEIPSNQLKSFLEKGFNRV